MRIAADICVYTNHNFIMEKLEANEDARKRESEAKQGLDLNAPRK